MSLTKHAPAVGRIAGGNHCSAANDEPEPGERRLVLVRQIAEVHARQMGHLYGNRCPDLDLMRARRAAILGCEAELRALRSELADCEAAS